jgi:hypothetical protein
MAEPGKEPESKDAPAAAKTHTSHATNPWAFPVMWMVIVLILAGSGLYVFRSCMQLPGKAGAQLAEIAAAFKQGTITSTFTSYAASVGGSQDFQFGHITEHVVFTRKDEKTYGWGYVPMPDVIVEADAPVNFIYYLNLNDRWDFQLRDGTIYVIAPDIKYNKPAVDISKVTYTVKKDSILRNTTDAMENLRASITSMSFKKAEENIPLIRETGRKQTETFVQNWLSKSFADGHKYPVKVLFRAETKTNGFNTVIKPE